MEPQPVVNLLFGNITCSHFPCCIVVDQISAYLTLLFFIHMLHMFFGVMATRAFRVLCVGDSRLRHIQLLLNGNCRDIQYCCFVFPGATLGKLAYELRIILSFVDNHYYDLVLIVGGICDLTRYQKTPTRWISLAYPSIQGIVDNFERLYVLCRNTIGLFTHTPILFSTIPGIHMNRYIGSDSMNLYQEQPKLDTAIPLINIIIKESSKLHGLPVADLAKFIHHSKGKGGTYRTRYCRLSDGCHPDEQTRQMWAEEILKVTTNYLYS